MVVRPSRRLLFVPVLGLAFFVGCEPGGGGTTSTAPEGHTGEVHGKISAPAKTKAPMTKPGPPPR